MKQAEKDLERTQREIKNLVMAVAGGADVTMLLDAQGELKARLDLSQANPEGLLGSVHEKTRKPSAFCGRLMGVYEIHHPNARRFSSEYQRYENRSNNASGGSPGGWTGTTTEDATGP